MRVEEGAFAIVEGADDVAKQGWEQLGKPVSYGLKDYTDQFMNAF